MKTINLSIKNVKEIINVEHNSDTFLLVGFYEVYLRLDSGTILQTSAVFDKRRLRLLNFCVKNILDKNGEICDMVQYKIKFSYQLQEKILKKVYDFKAEEHRNGKWSDYRFPTFKEAKESGYHLYYNYLLNQPRSFCYVTGRSIKADECVTYDEDSDFKEIWGDN